MEEDTAESPSDKLTARELKRKEPSRPSIKFRLDKVEEDFETGEIFVEGPSVKKIYTSQESFSRSRISNMDVAKFFLSCLWQVSKAGQSLSKLQAHLLQDLH